MGKSTSEGTELPRSYFSRAWWKLYFTSLYAKGYASNPVFGAIDAASSTRTASWSIGGAYLGVKYPLVLKFVGAIFSKIWGLVVAIAVVARDLVSALWHSVI